MRLNNSKFFYKSIDTFLHSLYNRKTIE